jgi:hypothetical protein
MHYLHNFFIRRRLSRRSLSEGGSTQNMLLSQFFSRGRKMSRIPS